MTIVTMQANGDVDGSNHNPPPEGGIGGNERPPTADAIPDVERHAQFVTALDNLSLQECLQDGHSGLEQLASTLHWPLAEVEQHAYRYFCTLQDVDNCAHIMRTARFRQQEVAVARVHRQQGLSPGPGWTPEETRLLHTLLASSTLQEDDLPPPHQIPRLATFFPQHTVEQVERQIYYLRQLRRLRDATDMEEEGS